MAGGLANFKSAYSVLGMMLIGINLVQQASFKVDVKFLLSTFFYKFLVWPMMVFLIIHLRLLPAAWLSQDAVTAMFLISIVPLAGNCVVVAVNLNVFPEKVAAAVMGSTIFSMVIIPVFLASLLGSTGLAFY